ncbi:MAG: DEAD/DEAH box helicase, partial [Erysipelotrichia bacterium]|nr:DEAD/DEAH box helicase [Erysipelotrichia bacterium]
MKSNFEFLDEYWPKLSKIGETAETYLYTDPNSCAYKIGLFAESIIVEIFNIEDLKVEIGNHSERLKFLKREGLLPFTINEMFHALRLKRNNAVHNNIEINTDDALTMLKMAHNIASWFMEVYGDWNYLKVPFVAPQKLEKIDYSDLLKKQEDEIEKLSKGIVQIKTKESDKSQKERIIQSNQVSDSIELSESETRFIIDEQLRRVGWEADTYNIRYSKGVRPQKGRNLAIAEWPTDSNVGKNGYADYALFVGLDFMGIIEAKKSNIDVSSVIDYQCKEYASHIKEEHREYCMNQWSIYSIPFVFSTNGRKYLKQIETKSGIWFLDLRQSYNVSKALKGWVSPNGIQELYEKNIKKGDYQLDNMPYDFLRDPDGLNLRPYQIKAIEKTEEAIKNGKQKVLLSMATGTGKTRTILGMIYRLVKSKRFKRVLFLVDRTSLGTQAIDVFNEVKIEDLMTLDSIYNIKGLEDKNIDKETKIQVATVQSMIKRVLLNDDEDMPSVTDFDLIIVDEAHRGYILDKEMSDDELLYRNQDEYTSKYRSVIEYFDAVKIGLTATPRDEIERSTYSTFDLEEGLPTFHYEM